MGYRKDIQILRGIAVLLVVLFHLGFTTFKSGFLAVDVFFVISGYLMAVMYDPARKADFYMKRAKRLLPAYFAVVISTLIAAAVITTPNEYAQVETQSIFATFFSSNIGFWLENSYFDKAAFKPLLHLWSLGVELQFYLIVPVLAWAFRKIRFSYAAVLLGSAALCFVVVGVSTKTSFFWMPLRLWEFLIGYGVAKRLRAAPDTASGKAWLGAAALVAIVAIPAISIDGEALGFRHGHPGLIALLISLATAVVLALGLPKAVESNPVANVLERIGDASYSIYLAHFPVIVLFLYRPFSGTVLKSEGAGQLLTLIVLVAAAAVLLYYGIEKPFRKSGRALQWAAAAGALTLVLGPIGLTWQKAVLPEKELLVYDAWTDRDVYRCGKLARIAHPTAISCEITQPLGAPAHRVLLVGNSHADSIKHTFAAVAQSKNTSVYFMVENTPLMVGGIAPEGLMAEARRLHVDSLVLHYSPKSISADVVKKIVALAQHENIKVSFIMPVPVWHQHVPMMILKNEHDRVPLPASSIDDYRTFNQDLISGLADVTGPNFRTYEVAELFCRPACTLMSQQGKPLYFDSDHLTLTGSARLEGVFSQLLDDLA